MAATAERERPGAVFSVEQRGIEAVPLDERHGRPRDLTFLWPSWAAVLLLSVLHQRRRTPRRARIAIGSWVVATLLSLGFVNNRNVFPALTHPFNQPLIDALHGADLSGVVSGIVAAGSYWIATQVSRSTDR